MAVLGKMTPPTLPLSAFPSSPLPFGCLTLKPAHPEAPGDVTPPDLFTFIKERVFGLLSLLPSLLLHVLHSCALTEAVYHSECTSAVTTENAAVVGVRKARERAATFQRWLDRTGSAFRAGSLRAASNTEIEPC